MSIVRTVAQLVCQTEPRVEDRTNFSRDASVSVASIYVQFQYACSYFNHLLDYGCLSKNLFFKELKQGYSVLHGQNYICVHLWNDIDTRRSLQCCMSNVDFQ